MTINKIITHAGAWHADEISAISIFSILHNLPLVVKRSIDPVTMLPNGKYVQPFLGEIPIERKFVISEEELADPTVLVLDIGRMYDTSLSNLDHHQDGELGASNILMLGWLKGQGHNATTFLKLKDYLFSRISDIDRGIIAGGGESWEFNSIIKACDSFEQALELSIGIISRMLKDIEKELLDVELFNALPVIGKVALNKDSNILLGWKEAAKAKGLWGLVTPNARGGFNLISRDSEAFTIPITDNQTFRHESGFMAVYATQQEAIQAGEG